MPGPQRLARMRVEFFGNAVLLPALHNLQCPAIGGEDGVAQRLVLFIEQKQPLTLRRNADPIDLVAVYACILEQRGDGGVAVLPELMHIPLGVARSRAERGNGAAFDTNFFALAGV